MPFPVLYQDPFSPILKSSPALELTEEQRLYIREVLEICSSDSKFAEKAWIAIRHILSGGSVTVPVVANLAPNSATLGDPNFTLHVHGTGFSVLSIIVFNGSEEPTTYISDTEVTTEVDMSTATTAGEFPVLVVSGEGVPSNAVMFTFQPIALLSAPSSKSGPKDLSSRKDLGPELSKQAKELELKDRVENFNTPHDKVVEKEVVDEKKEKK